MPTSKHALHSSLQQPRAAPPEEVGVLLWEVDRGPEMMKGALDAAPTLSMTSQCLLQIPASPGLGRQR